MMQSIINGGYVFRSDWVFSHRIAQQSSLGSCCSSAAIRSLYWILDCTLNGDSSLLWLFLMAGLSVYTCRSLRPAGNR